MKSKPTKKLKPTVGKKYSYYTAISYIQERLFYIDAKVFSLKQAESIAKNKLGGSPKVLKGYWTVRRYAKNRWSASVFAKVHD